MTFGTAGIGRVDQQTADPAIQLVLDHGINHIDVAPTVLDLLGVEGGRSYEEGSAIWDSRLQERTTFFFAQSFLGADAYAEHGRFTMIRHLPASVFRSGRLHFELGDMAPVDGQARPTLERMVRLQQALGRVTAATP